MTTAAGRISVIALVASFASVLHPTAAGPDQKATGSKAPPNIVLILTDDLDAQAAAFMPHVKTLLAERGINFSRYFVTDSLCCPSRASILRGQYVHNHGVRGNQPPLGGFEKFHALGHENATIGTWLKQAGYRTALMGKYLNGYARSVEDSYHPPGWDAWASPLDDRGYAGFNYRLNENGSVVAYARQPSDYFTDVLARKASAFVEASVKARVPFFLYLATYAPHQPATPAPRHAALFPDAKAPRTPAFDEADVSRKPRFIQRLGRLTEQEIAAIDTLYRRRLQSLQAVDDLIRDVVEALTRSGALDRTYILFTSDNGFHLGQHRMPMGKRTAYEEDIRVPLIVRGPGVPPGRTLDHLATELDLAPTFLSWAGAALPGLIDGRSLTPLLGSDLPPPDRWRQGLLVEHYSGSSEPFESTFEREQRRLVRTRIPTYEALRTRDYTYVEYKTGERELYDLARDPAELTNLAGSADPVLIGRLASQVAALRTCAGASCRAAEGPANQATP